MRGMLEWARFEINSRAIDHVVFLSAIRFSWFIVRLLSSAPESLADRSGISLSERNQADGLIRIGG